MNNVYLSLKIRRLSKQHAIFLLRVFTPSSSLLAKIYFLHTAERHLTLFTLMDFLFWEKLRLGNIVDNK